MASSSRQAVAAVLAAAVVLLLLSGSTTAVRDITTADDDECPLLGKLVYPYRSTCGAGVEGAALYFGEEVYELGVVSSIGSLVGRLAPEWDETNSTFYVRAAAVAAKYKFTYATYEWRGVVAQNDSLFIVNVETGRYLGWRREGENEWFLVEVDTQDEPSSAEYFKFSRAPFACSFVRPIACEAYYILQAAAGSNSLGVTPYVEDGVFYFELATVPAPFILPFPHATQKFVIFRSTSTSTASAVA